MKPFTLFEELCYGAEPTSIYAGLKRADALTIRGLAREEEALAEISAGIAAFADVCHDAPDMPGSIPSGPGKFIWKRLAAAEMIDGARHGWMMEILINDLDAADWHTPCPGCEIENLIWAPACRSCGAALPAPL